MAKFFRVAAMLTLVLIVLPPSCFMAFYDPSTDHGHPPGIIIPILWVAFGFGVAGPIGVGMGIISLWLREQSVSTAKRIGLVATMLLMAVGSVIFWVYYAKTYWLD